MHLNSLSDVFKKCSYLMVYDRYSDQYIPTTKEKWYEAESKTNKMLHCNDESVGINSVIATMGGIPKKELNEIGWSLSDDACEWNMSYFGDFVQLIPHVTSLIDGVAWVTIEYLPEPLELDRTDNVWNEAM